MAIEIRKILQILDKKLLLAEVRHYDEVLTVLLSGDANSTETINGEEVTFEMNYKRILSWKVIEKGEHTHGLFGYGDNVIIRGEVCNQIDIGDDVIIDIYISKGPEFISLLSSELNGHVPEERESIELLVEGLCIYPTYH